MAAHRPDGLEVRCDSRAESGPDPWEMAGVLNPPPKNQQPPETSREYMKNMGFSRGFSIYIHTYLGRISGVFPILRSAPTVDAPRLEEFDGIISVVDSNEEVDLWSFFDSDS